MSSCLVVYATMTWRIPRWFVGAVVLLGLLYGLLFGFAAWLLPVQIDLTRQRQLFETFTSAQNTINEFSLGMRRGCSIRPLPKDLDAAIRAQLVELDCLVKKLDGLGEVPPGSSRRSLKMKGQDS